jgi:hypothetical protein
MATITATFSNGHTDKYQGGRAVTAAWMVVEKATGKVVNSGHSLNRAGALKTARGSIPRAITMPSGWREGKNTMAGHRVSKTMGYGSPEEYERDARAQNAKLAGCYTVETVDL